MIEAYVRGRGYRRRTFVALGAAFCAAGTAASAQSGLVAVRVSSAPDEDVLGALWAQQSGIFKRDGLDVTITPANSGAAVAAAVVGGAVDVGKSSLISLIAAHARGVPFVLIAPAGVYTAAHPIVGMLVKKGSPIRSPRDLDGKTISVPALNDQYSIAIKAWMDQNGADSQSVRFVELPNSAVPQAIADGRIDGAAIANPILSEALDSGNVDVIGRPFDAIGRLFIQAAYFCTSDYAAKNRDTVRRFSRAIAESGAYVNAHPAQTVGILSQFTKVPATTIEHMTRTQIGTTLDARAIQPVIDAAVKYKAIPTGFDARDMIAPFLR